jgi:hypothetical protein
LGTKKGRCDVARGGRRETVVKKMGSWTTGKRQRRVEGSQRKTIALQRRRCVYTTLAL